MKFTKKLTAIAGAMIMGAASLFAASPSFSLNMNGAIGAYNILNNRTVSSVPGLSAQAKFDFDFGVKGSFGKEATLKSSGYSSGARIDVDSLYRNYISGNSSKGTYTNNYEQIQPMIDWYEANKHRYDLPDNPFGEKGWPTTKYGEGVYSYKFIEGTTVESIDDVNWNDTGHSIWASADALYHDVKSHIEDAINSLYKNKGIAVGDKINQELIAKMPAELQEYALLKLEAINSFKHLSSSKSYYPAATAYADFTNIAQMFDISINIAGAKLQAGKIISSARTGQQEYGSSISFGLTKDFIKGLKADITFGVAGGVPRTTEDWTTQDAEYNPGKYAEVGVALNADYTYRLRDLKLDITSGIDFVMPDLLIATENNSGAIRAGIHWNDMNEYIDGLGFYIVDPTTLRDVIEVADNLEFVYAYTKDRYDRFDNASFTFGFKNELYVNAYGLEAQLDTAYKGANFESKYRNQVEDRFMGKNINVDFANANLAGAALIDFDLAYNTFRLFNTELLSVSAGFDALIYDNAAIGLGWNAGIACNLKDYVKNDLIISAGIDWYRNTRVKTFEDMSTLDDQKFIDFATIEAGIEYKPSRNFSVGLDFVTAPSESRRYNTRIMSVEATVGVRY